jgi:hypothetical protein
MVHLLIIKGTMRLSRECVRKILPSKINGLFEQILKHIYVIEVLQTPFFVFVALLSNT